MSTAEVVGVVLYAIMLTLMFVMGMTLGVCSMLDSDVIPGKADLLARFYLSVLGYAAAACAAYLFATVVLDV